MSKKKKTVGLQFVPSLSDPHLGEGHLSSLMNSDSRIASPFVVEYLTLFWPDGFEKDETKGIDGYIGSKRIEARCLNHNVFFGLQIDNGGGRDCNYDKLRESLRYRDAFLVTDIRSNPWTTIEIPVKTIKSWLRKRKISSSGHMTPKRFWNAIDEEFDVSYTVVK